MKEKIQREKKLTTPYGMKSFIGFLEGTGKSAHTIKSYRSDLFTFQTFLEERLSHKKVEIKDLTPKDLMVYSEYLESEGMKINTRRRKLLTVRRFLKYLNSRNKLTTEIGYTLPAPHKVERVPKIFDVHLFIRRVKSMKTRTVPKARDRILIWTIAETGGVISEVVKLSFSAFEKSGKQAYLNYSQKKGTRKVEISNQLFSSVMEFKKQVKREGMAHQFIFMGFNPYAPLGTVLSDRGAEMILKSYEIELKVKNLTPRKVRHSCAVHWLRSGIEPKEVQRRLGLKTGYSLKIYEPLLKTKSKMEATSSEKTTVLKSGSQKK